MRTRAVVVIAMLALPSGLAAQRIPRPPVTRTPVPKPAPPPREAPGVARALAYTRSRWSAEGYVLTSALMVPTGGGGLVNQWTFGTGTRGEYRYTDHLSATVDLTFSPLGGTPTTSADVRTAELGTRYSPRNWERKLRPFVDVRAGYMTMTDSYIISGTPAGGPAGTPGTDQQFAQEWRYSRGFGGVAGLGTDYSITDRLALTTEVSAMRNRMNVNRATGPASAPDAGTAYWMTSVRWSLGLKFAPKRILHMAQTSTGQTGSR